MSAVVGSVCL